MRKSLAILVVVERLLGTVQLIVGLGIWFGLPMGAVTFHSAVGSLFVLVLWIVALIALFALPKRGVALFTLLWGGLVLWFGMAQTTFVPGGGHWTVRLAHLIIGVAAMGLSEALGAAVKRHSLIAGAAPGAV